MCRWCVRSEMADRLTAGIAPTRREFLAYAASFALAAGSASTARADSPAEVIFRNGPIYPMAETGGARIEALPRPKAPTGTWTCILPCASGMTVCSGPGSSPVTITR